MKKNYYPLLAILLLSFSVNAFAEGDESISFLPGIIGTSCGPGWHFNSQATWVGITTRSLVNLTSSSSVAVTSGTSGCAKHNLVKRLEINGIYYAHYNYEALIENMAMGNGEHLNIFAKTYGCSDDVYQVFSEIARKNFSNIVPSNDKKPVTLYRSLKNIMKSNTNLASHCQALI